MVHIPKEIRDIILSYLPFRPKTKDELENAIKRALNKSSDVRKSARDEYGEIKVWDTSRITDMSGLFRPYQNFNQDISGWNVSNVENFSGMFQNCRYFNVDLSNWNVERGQDFSHMFHGARKFKKNLSKWKPRRARDMSYMMACTNMVYDIDEWKSYVDMNIPMKNIFYNAGLKRGHYHSYT